MSYRDDHDAAIARADALEHELAVTRAENERLRAAAATSAPVASPPAAPRRAGFGAAAALGFLGTGTLLGAAALPSLFLAVAGGALVVFAVQVALLTALVVSVGPGEIVVLGGRRRRRADGTEVSYRIVRTGRVVRMPLIETATRMDVTDLDVELDVKNVYTSGGRSVDVRATARVSFSPGALEDAVERFLGAPRERIAQVARETLEGHLRGVIAQRTPEELALRDRLAEQVAEEVRDDLLHVGLEVADLVVTEVG